MRNRGATSKLLMSVAVIGTLIGCGVPRSDLPDKPGGSVKSISTATLVHWKKPTGGPYPTVRGDDISIEVDISEQRAHVKSGDKTIYTMIISSGIDSTSEHGTPLGTYHIQAERGTWFYAPKFAEGAAFWVSFLNHGEYLFHSVPMNKDKQVIQSEARKLGHEASHGCIRLNIPDAKWIYENTKTGTTVVIHE